MNLKEIGQQQQLNSSLLFLQNCSQEKPAFSRRECRTGQFHSHRGQLWLSQGQGLARSGAREGKSLSIHFNYFCYELSKGCKSSKESTPRTAKIRYCAPYLRPQAPLGCACTHWGSTLPIWAAWDSHKTPILVGILLLPNFPPLLVSEDSFFLLNHIKT